MKKKILTILCSLILSSCISRLDKHGYMFDLSDQSSLQEGVTTKERLLRIMGSPTIIFDFDKNESWIYYSEQVRNLLFFTPKILSREILVIRFDNFDTVKELKKIDITKEKNSVQFVSNYTEVGSHEISFFKSIFTNIGKVNPQ